MNHYAFLVMSKDIKSYNVSAETYEEAFDKVIAISDAASPNEIHLMDVCGDTPKKDNCFHWQQKDNVKSKFIFK